MNTFPKLFSVFLLLALFVGLFVTLPVVSAAPSLFNEERGLLFVSNVLPYDMSKYTITTTRAIESLSNSFANNRYYEESFEYTLNAGEESTIILNVIFRDNILVSCIVKSSTGPIFTDVPNTPKSFLERYQVFNGEDLSDMLNAIDKTDAKSGNVELRITSANSGSYTYFAWHIVINSVDYNSLNVAYHNSDFYMFYDNRGINKIGNTAVNIAQEQAVDLALQYMQTYSYKAMSGSHENPQYVDVHMTGFNVTIERISCKLIAHPNESSLLGPCWMIELPLEGTNSGLWALSVFVDAVSGEVVYCAPLILAVVGDFSIAGTSDVSSSINVGTGRQTTNTNVDSFATGTNLKPQQVTDATVANVNSMSDSGLLSSFDSNLFILIALGLMTIIAIPTAILAVKKRSK